MPPPSPPPAFPDAVRGYSSLPRETVSLWLAHLDGPETQIADRAASLWPALNSEERDRTERLRAESDRQRFILARGFLRSILGDYLGCAAADVPLTLGEQGKPLCREPDGGELVPFNLSHSHGIALLGVSASGAIGVDLEAVRFETDWKRLTRRFFAPRETEWLLSLPEEEGRAAFFRCWTAKEAFLKAVGVGLTRPLSAVEVAPVDSTATSLRFVRIEGETEEASRWHLRTFAPLPGFQAAVASDISLGSLSLQTWGDAEGQAVEGSSASAAFSPSSA